jgi:hypothetical protein
MAKGKLKIGRTRWIIALLSGVLIVGFACIQLGVTVRDLWISVYQYPGRKLVADLGMIRQENSRMRGPSIYQSVPAFNEDSTFTDKHLKYTRDRIDPNEYASFTFPEYLAKYAIYDSSAKKALLDLQNWLFENKQPLPLFQNLLSVEKSHQSQTNPRVCVAVVSANRDGSPFSY